MKESFPSSEKAQRNYYEILGISRGATPAEIKSAFRKLAIQWHPDKNPGDHEAEERFKEISGANDILSDENKRRLYDATLPTEKPRDSSFRRPPNPPENFYGDSQPRPESSTGNAWEDTMFETMRRHGEEAFDASEKRRRETARANNAPSSADMEEAYRMNLSRKEDPNENIERYKTEDPILYREILAAQEIERTIGWKEWNRRHSQTPGNPTNFSADSNAKRLEDQKKLEQLRREILGDKR